MVDAEVYLGEGIESDDVGAIDEPPEDLNEYFRLRSTRVIYQTNNFFLPQIHQLIKDDGTVNLRPEYQRRLRWTNKQKSALIESFLLNIPVPPVFFFEAEDARYEVMDGQQRLNAVFEFFRGDFKLASLNKLKHFNRLGWSELPARAKRALERASLAAIVLLKESEQHDVAEKTASENDEQWDLRRLVFDRLNTGGRQLKPQEIRNALNPGPFNNLLISISQEELFTDAFDIPPHKPIYSDEEESPERRKNSLYASMRDCELVLRFFALQNTAEIKGSMKSMLDKAATRKISEAVANDLRQQFLDRLRVLQVIFENDLFRLPENDAGIRRISAALYDSSMVALDKCWAQKDQILADASSVRSRLEGVFGDEEKLALLTGQKNTAEAVKQRISLFESVLVAR